MIRLLQRERGRGTFRSRLRGCQWWMQVAYGHYSQLGVLRSNFGIVCVVCEQPTYLIRRETAPLPSVLGSGNIGCSHNLCCRIMLAACLSCFRLASPLCMTRRSCACVRFETSLCKQFVVIVHKSSRVLISLT